NIAGTLENIIGALSTLPIQHEILVIDDGSRDATGVIVSDFSRRFPAVRLLINDRNRGFGWTYRRGVENASLDSIVMVHGDNAWGAKTLRSLFEHLGDADVVIGYTRNMWRTRSWTRTAVSKTFTMSVNLITRHRLKYYNGLQIHPAPVLKQLTIESNGFGFQAEVLAKSLRLTKTFIEVPMDLNERAHGESKAFRVKNVVDVARTLGRLFSLEWSTSK
ncbi:MAG TPA: glycosyltransferase family 2 protein, partial [Vicinamibacterales bacterium]|nr:glycosyltransferase family 2 protein [Vicinamibacterales bacterium]